MRSTPSSRPVSAAHDAVVMTTMKTAMCNDFIGYFGDSSYLNQDGDIVIATLPDDLHALLLTLLRRNDLST